MKRKWKACLCIAAFLLAVLPVSASADMGPKPQITIQVQNAPDGDYYVDLLIPGEVPEQCIDNIEWNHIDRASLPLDALERDRMDGWHYAMLDGTQPPLFYKHPDKDTFVFSYFGTPDTFRIAVYDDSQQKVNFSEVMKRTQLQQIFTFDFADNTVKTGNPLLTYLKQFASSLLPTLLLEGILLLPFGFWDRRNAKLFFVVNIGTQLLLTVVTAACMWIGMPFYRYLVFAAGACDLDHRGCCLPQTAADPAGDGSSDRLRAVRQRTERSRDFVQRAHGISVGLSEKNTGSFAYSGILWYAIRSKGGERPCQPKHTIICPDCLNFTSFTAHSCRYTAQIVTGFMTGVRLGPFTAHRRTASGEADERVSVSAAHAKRWLWHRSTAFPRG